MNPLACQMSEEIAGLLEIYRSNEKTTTIL